MQIDKTTLADLNIFGNADDQLSVYQHVNQCRTNGGAFYLQQLMQKPLSTVEAIEQTQQLLQRIIAVQAHWPTYVTNGTIMVVERFYDTPVGDMPMHPNLFNAYAYKWLNGADYALVRYSIKHVADLVKGMLALHHLLQSDANPPLLKQLLAEIEQVTQAALTVNLTAYAGVETRNPVQVLQVGNFLQRFFKQQALSLVQVYSKLDAYFGMASTIVQYGYTFPKVSTSGKPMLTAAQLYHPLLPTPTAYDVELLQAQNFLFLTGANMAGKSTFIKAVGVAAYLAHIGMAVPAKQMHITCLEGLLSNIQMADNLIKGESYFFNEVQRIKKTIEKINDGKPWLILIDELFKGTNVQDAMKCSTAVIEGLRKMQNAIFILSTHLYEIAAHLQQYENLQFRYFETAVANEQLVFSYQLKEGVSNDRLGYLILKREGVVEMLEAL